MHFARPENLYWLFILVPMAAAAVWYWRWQTRVRDDIGDENLVDEMVETHSPALRISRIGLTFAGVALLCLALAQPQWGRIQQEVEQVGIDVVFALDLSKSMLARDVAPTRLEAATDEIEETLDRLDGDRVGMVVFTTVSFVQSPLTTDYGSIRFYLDKLDPSQMSVGGTAVGRALRDSVELLTGRSLGHSDDSEAARNARMDRADNQLVVLITDGEDHSTDPVSAAKTARKNGIKILSVGIGSERGAKIPILGRDGRVRGYKRDSQGETVETRLEEKQLREIADEGGGIYIRYGGKHSISNRLTEFVNQLEKSKLEARLAAQYRDRYLWFLIPGFSMLLIAFLLGERRRGRFGWSNASSALTVILFLFLAASLTSGCDTLLKARHDKVEQGNKHLKNGNFSDALKAYAEAKKSFEEPEPTLHYDRGLAHLGAEKHEKARKAFARALESPDPGIWFDTHYNVGLSFSQEKKWKPALEEYKHAFRVYQRHPDSIEKDALRMLRHNTELAYRRLYPPCRTQEDKLEENDQPDQASILKKPEKKDLTLCGLDDDWFAVQAVPGSTVTIEATFRQLGEHEDPEQTFLPQPDDLKLELLDANGENVLASDLGDASKKGPIDDGPVDRTIDEFVVDRQMNLGKDSRLLARLSAADKLEYAYDVSIHVQPPCRALEEKSEENDTPEQAEKIDKGDHKGQICAGDPDWFRIDAEMGDSVFVDLRPAARKKGEKPAPDSLELEMVDASTGNPVGHPHREGGFTTAGLHQIRTKRSLLVGISGKDETTEAAYRLTVYRFPPCIIGDDKYEENDSLEAATQFKGKKKKKKHHRYLRLCSDDPDFFAMKPSRPKKPKKGSGKQTPKGKKNLAVGLQIVERSPGAEPSDAGLAAFDPDDGDIVAMGKPPKSRKKTADVETSRPPFDEVLRLEDVDHEKVPVRVSGPPTFYHLVDLTGGNNQSKQKNEKNKKQKQDENKQDEQQKKQNDKQKRSKKKEQRKSPRQSQKKKKKSARKKKKKRKPADEQRMKDILKALEDSDKNFQMRKALEDAKKNHRGVDKDW